MVLVQQVTYVSAFMYVAHLDLDLALWTNFEIDVIGSKLNLFDPS